MRTKMARRWLAVSVCLIAFSCGAFAADAPPPASIPDPRIGPADKELAGQIAALKAPEKKSFDDLVRLALLSRKLHDEAGYEQWLAAAAQADPSTAFTSGRSPFIYVRAWSKHLPPHVMNPSVRKTSGGIFYMVLSDGRIQGICRIDSLLQDIKTVRMNEIKAEYAGSLASDYEQNFYLVNQGIVFAFSPAAAYLGQMVCMQRHKLRGSSTLTCALDRDTFYVSDHYRYIGIMNWHADTLKYIELPAGEPSSTIVTMDDDKDRRLFVAVTGDNVVVVLNPDLAERMRFGGSGAARGQMLCLADVSAANTAIVTADSSLRRMQVFDKNAAWLMDIPSRAYSLAVGDDGTIVALEDAGIACYVRLYKPAAPQYDPEFRAYLQAIALMEEGKPNEARPLLEPLANSTDPNLSQVAASLMKNGTLALARHYQKPRPLADPEIARLLGFQPKAIFRDAPGRCIWASMNDGFIRRIDEWERVNDFDSFPALYSLTGKLIVNDMRFDKDCTWAETNRGVCRFSRSDGDWQFYKLAKKLKDVPAQAT